MSARDSESGSSTYKGGSGSSGAGGLGNGGIGGGRGAGGMGGGAGRNGGAGSQTGLSTGKDWYGNTAFGRSGGRATGYATRDARSLAKAGMGPTMGAFGQFKTMQGQPMFGGLLGDDTFTAPNATAAYAQAYERWRQMTAPQVTQPVARPTGRPAIGQPVEDLFEVPVSMPASWPWANPAVINPFPQYAGQGGWLRGANWNNDAGSWPRSRNTDVYQNNLGNGGGYGPGTTFQPGG